MARHLAPFSCRQRMAEIVRRRSWGGVLPLGRHASISGSSLIQCASASMAPPHPGGAKCYPGEEVQGRTGPRHSEPKPLQPIFTEHAVSVLIPLIVLGVLWAVVRHWILPF